MSEPTQVYRIYIRTTKEKLWRAITDPAFTRLYYYGTAVRSDFGPGSVIAYLDEHGDIVADGEVIAAEPERRLVMTFGPKWDPEMAKEPPVRMTWEIEPQGELCLLTVIHEGIVPGGAIERSFAGGMPFILSGLKTLLETGSPLARPTTASA